MIANKTESNAPAIIQYLRKTGRLFNLLVTDETAKADKTRLAKLAVAIINREVFPNLEFVASCR
jgi:hypothetical protein